MDKLYGYTVNSNEMVKGNHIWKENELPWFFDLKDAKNSVSANAVGRMAKALYEDKEVYRFIQTNVFD